MDSILDLKVMYKKRHDICTYIYGCPAFPPKVFFYLHHQKRCFPTGFSVVIISFFGKFHNWASRDPEQHSSCTEKKKKNLTKGQLPLMIKISNFYYKNLYKEINIIKKGVLIMSKNQKENQLENK